MRVPSFEILPCPPTPLPGTVPPMSTAPPVGVHMKYSVVPKLPQATPLSLMPSTRPWPTGI